MPRGIRLCAACERGFTMIEVLFAGLVLAVAMLGMLSLITIGHGVSRTAWEMTIAKNAAKGKLEEVREAAELDFFALEKTYGGEAGAFDVPRLKAPRGGDLGDTTGRVLVSKSIEGQPGLLDVRVIVRWWGVGGNQTIEYRTRLSPM